MLNVDINRIRKEDAINAHALVLTLKHINHSNDVFTINYQYGKYCLYIDDVMYEYDTFDNIPMFVLCSLIKDFDELVEARKFYSNVLKVGFSNTDAVDYLNFYSESGKKLEKVK